MNMKKNGERKNNSNNNNKNDNQRDDRIQQAYNKIIT